MRGGERKWRTESNRQGVIGESQRRASVLLFMHLVYGVQLELWKPTPGPAWLVAAAIVAPCLGGEKELLTIWERKRTFRNSLNQAHCSTGAPGFKMAFSKTQGSRGRERVENYFAG